MGGSFNQRIDSTGKKINSNDQSSYTSEYVPGVFSPQRKESAKQIASRTKAYNQNFSMSSCPDVPSEIMFSSNKKYVEIGAA